MSKSSPLRSAWVVAWESIGDQPLVPTDREVVAVLNYRWSGSKVREITEQLYASLNYTPHEKLRAAWDRTANPYPARFGELNGVPWTAEVLCGHNPWLKARMVKNLRTIEVEDGAAKLCWEELPRPKSQLAP